MKKIFFTSIIIFNLIISWSQNFPISGATWVFNLISPYVDDYAQKWEYVGDSTITEKSWHYDVSHICGTMVDSGPFNLICYWDDSTSNTQCLSTIDWFNHLSTQEAEQLQYEIYPNPAQNKLSITFPSQQKYAIRVTNLQGKEMLRIIHKNGNLTPDMNVSELSSGVYLIIVENETGELMREKFVKQ